MIFATLFFSQTMLKCFLYINLTISNHFQEIAAKELSNMQEQKTNLANELKELTERSEKLEKLYEEQEKLLDEIFDGEYGSEDENKMENILDQVRMWRRGHQKERDRERRTFCSHLAARTNAESCGGGQLQVAPGPAHGGLRLQAAPARRTEVGGGGRAGREVSAVSIDISIRQQWRQQHHYSLSLSLTLCFQ